MELTVLVIVAALLQYFGFAFAVAAIRQKTGIEPPVMVGDETLERAIAVHRNTGEFIPIFVTLMLICGYFSSDALAAGVGLVWILARFVYRSGGLTMLAPPQFDLSSGSPPGDNSVPEPASGLAVLLAAMCLGAYSLGRGRRGQTR